MRPVNPEVPYSTDGILQFLRTYLTDLFNILRNISFGDGTNSSEAQNTDTRILDGVSDVTPGTETIFTHILGRIPVGIIIVRQDKAGSLYTGATAWTKTAISLKSDAVSLAFKVILF